MRRGEIRWVDLDPARGSESDKRRPGVIVSNDGANAVANRLGRGIVTVVPITSSTERIYPFQVHLDARSTGLPVDSKAQADAFAARSRLTVAEADERRVAAMTDLPGAVARYLERHGLPGRVAGTYPEFKYGDGILAPGTRIDYTFNV